MEKLRYKRILVKLSGEAMTGSAEFGIDPPVVAKMVSELKRLLEIGVEVGVVVGGG